ncbi:MAG: hypothetical protein ISS34_07330 [Candidatus Omnitrophica bacterium]|nr:hypothetical protein [Candidatus Omnitrophota bacterium]
MRNRLSILVVIALLLQGTLFISACVAKGKDIQNVNERYIISEAKTPETFVQDRKDLETKINVKNGIENYATTKEPIGKAIGEINHTAPSIGNVEKEETGREILGINSKDKKAIPNVVSQDNLEITIGELDTGFSDDAKTVKSVDTEPVRGAALRGTINKEEEEEAQLPEEEKNRAVLSQSMRREIEAWGLGSDLESPDLSLQDNLDTNLDENIKPEGSADTEYASGASVAVTVQRERVEVEDQLPQEEETRAFLSRSMRREIEAWGLGADQDSGFQDEE